MKLLWFTDLHLVEQGEMLHGVDPCARFSRCLDAAVRSHPDAKLIVVTGDLAHSGARAAYPLLANILERYAIPHRLLPGNHDDISLLSEELYAKAGYSVMRTYQERLDDLNLLYLNTCPSRFVRCGLDDLQIEWLANQLESADDLPTLILLHHPPFPTGIPGVDVEVFENRESLRRLLLGARRPPHLLCGHCHRNISGSWSGIPFTALCSTHLSFVLNLSTAELARRPSDPEYAVIVADDEFVAIHFSQLTLGERGSIVSSMVASHE